MIVGVLESSKSVGDMVKRILSVDPNNKVEIFYNLDDFLDAIAVENFKFVVIPRSFEKPNDGKEIAKKVKIIRNIPVFMTITDPSEKIEDLTIYIDLFLSKQKPETWLKKIEKFFKDNTHKETSNEIDKFKILIAEDSKFLAKAIERNLKEKFEVKVVYNGLDLVKETLNFLPDLIISDIFMPKLSGLEAGEIIKLIPFINNTPIIFITGHPNEELRKLVSKVGGIALLSKDSGFDELISFIKTYLDIKNKRKLKVLDRKLFEKINWEKSNGLLPVITQHIKTGQILMMAYANKEALLKTLETGLAHYYSRSRKLLWLKGETSKNYQVVKKIYIDCDEDSLLYLVLPKGPACHTGNQTCFYRILADEV